MSTIMVAQNPPALRLHGRVGFDETRPHFTAEAVAAALGQLRGKGRVAVSLNSTGGNSNESVAIAAALNAHPDGVEVIVEGVALSGAAFITCAVPQSAIAPGSTMMLHRASIDGKTSEKAAARDRVRLDAFDRSNAELIARKTGKPLSAVHEMLKAETWFTAEAAVKAGLVGRMIGEPEAPNYPDDCRDPAVLAEMACLAEQPAMAAILIRDGASVAQARQRLDTMATIGPMLAMMEHKPGITAALKEKVSTGRLSIAEARAALFNALADEDEKIVVDNKRLTGSGSPDGKAMMRESMIKQIEQKHGLEAAAKARSKLKEGRPR